MTPQDEHLLHELRMHQAELKMQNEELRQTQARLDAERARYVDLYDLAPVGYITLSADGLIRQTNRHTTTLLGVPRSHLLDSPFSKFMSPDCADRFYLLHQSLAECQAPQSCELQLKKPDGTLFWVDLTSTSVQDESGAPTLRVVLSDISARKLAEQQLQSSQALACEAAEHNQAILDHMVDSVITVSAEGLIESVNEATGHIFGYPLAQVLGQNVSMLMPEPHRSLHDSYLKRFVSTGTPRLLGQLREVLGQRQDGSIFPVSLSISKISRLGQPIFVALLRDNSQQNRDMEEIRRLAFFDPLTGLPNRRLLLDRLTQAIATSTRTGTHGALMFLDLDYFKKLNDQLGHDVGDLLLKMVANRLQVCVREGDSVARLGGDEFVVLLEGLSSATPEAAAQAELLANKIINVLGQPYNLHGLTHHSTPSMGITVFNGNQESVEELLKKSDAAMYQAKAAGRNTFRFFDPAMQAAAADHAQLETDLRLALAQQQFELYYQIQVNQHSEPIGAEALVRWNHPTRGLVAPAQFIALAEETHLILPLGQWVLKTACNQLLVWASSPQTAHWTMAINVSSFQFAQADFVSTVTDTLRQVGVNPTLLKLELTESMLVSNLPDVIVKMSALQALGVRFSLDDFGTGYSSLTYLNQLPLDQLKIDRSFVCHLQADTSDAVIAHAIVALGHNLGMKVIAEGVETAQQHDFLTGYACDAFQGFYFGNPMPALALADFTSKIAH